jgi:hypothetical protein
MNTVPYLQVAKLTEGDTCSASDGTQQFSELEVKENRPLTTPSSIISRKTLKRLEEFKRIDEEDSKQVLSSNSELPVASSKIVKKAPEPIDKKLPVCSTETNGTGKPSQKGNGILTAATLGSLLNKLQKAPTAKSATVLDTKPADAGGFLEEFNIDEEFDF